METFLEANKNLKMHYDCLVVDIHLVRLQVRKWQLDMIYLMEKHL